MLCKETAREVANLVTFAEEILNGKLLFLCSEIYSCLYFLKTISIIISLGF